MVFLTFRRAHPSTTESPPERVLRGLRLSPSSSAPVAEGSVSGKAAGQEISCGGEFFSDKAQSEEPGAHRVLRIVMLLWLRACAFRILRHLAECQAKLNVALKLAGVEAVSLAVCWGIELEKAEFNGPLGEGCVVVQQCGIGCRCNGGLCRRRRSGWCTKCLRRLPCWSASFC